MKTLADKAQVYLTNPPNVYGRTAKMAEPLFTKLRVRLRQARRFTLSSDFLEAACAASIAQPDVILRRTFLACNLPFESTWIEWDQELRTRISQRLGILAPEALVDEDRGLEGFLLLEDATEEGRWTGTGFYGDRGADGEATILMCGQSLTPISTSKPFTETEEWWQETVMSGWGLRPNPHLVDSPGYKAEFHQNMLALIERGGTSPEPRVIVPMMNWASERNLPDGAAALFKSYGEQAKETRGDLRFLVTVLSMINSVPTRYVHEKSTGRFTRRLKSMDYLDSHTVFLDVQGTKVVRLLERAAKAEISRRRRHEVRGFWRLAERGTGAQGCRHLPTGGDGRHCDCGKCGSRLVWVPSFMRGDAALGFVKKNYEVQ